MAALDAREQEHPERHRRGRAAARPRRRRSSPSTGSRWPRAAAAPRRSSPRAARRPRRLRRQLEEKAPRGGPDDSSPTLAGRSNASGMRRSPSCAARRWRWRWRPPPGSWRSGSTASGTRRLVMDYIDELALSRRRRRVAVREETVARSYAETLFELAGAPRWGRGLRGRAGAGGHADGRPSDARVPSDSARRHGREEGGAGTVAGGLRAADAAALPAGRGGEAAAAVAPRHGLGPMWRCWSATWGAVGWTSPWRGRYRPSTGRTWREPALLGDGGGGRPAHRGAGRSSSGAS